MELGTEAECGTHQRKVAITFQAEVVLFCESELAMRAGQVGYFARWLPLRRRIRLPLPDPAIPIGRQQSSNCCRVAIVVSSRCCYRKVDSLEGIRG